MMMKMDTAPIKVRFSRATWRYRRKRLVPTEFMPHSGYLIRSPPRNPKPGSSDLSASQPYRVLEPLKSTTHPNCHKRGRGFSFACDSKAKSNVMRLHNVEEIDSSSPINPFPVNAKHIRGTNTAASQ